jgi:hypothetical protein
MNPAWLVNVVVTYLGGNIASAYQPVYVKGSVENTPHGYCIELNANHAVPAQGQLLEYVLSELLDMQRF